MDAVLTNILSPPVLFFALGMLAVWVKSDLEMPDALQKLFTFWLLIDIGFHGGYELYHSGFNSEAFSALGACLIMAMVVPVYCFFILLKRLGAADAAAVAATFGSISAVTFISCIAYLETMEIPFSGYMVAGMALMEAPAIVVGVFLYNAFKAKSSKNTSEPKPKKGYGSILKHAFFNSSVLLLLGALTIGLLTGDKGWADFKPLDDLFKGILIFYLLDSGIVAARRIKSLKGQIGFLIVFSIAMALLNAGIALGMSFMFQMEEGNALLFIVLCASASYIAVPAAMRLSIPKSNPALTVPVALGIVFPFNVILGIPLYHFLIQTFAA